MWKCLFLLICFGFNKTAVSLTGLSCERRLPDGYGSCTSSVPGVDAMRSITGATFQECETACLDWEYCVKFSHHSGYPRCVIYSCETFDTFYAVANYLHYFCKRVELPDTTDAASTTIANTYQSTETDDVITTDMTTSEEYTTQTSEMTSLPVSSQADTTEQSTTQATYHTTQETTSTSLYIQLTTELITTTAIGIITTEVTMTTETTKQSTQAETSPHTTSSIDLTTTQTELHTETSTDNGIELCSTIMDKTTVTVFTTHGQYSRKHVSWIEVPSMRGRASTTNNSVLNLSINSRIGCCALCTTDTGCCSVLYNSISGTCIGFSQIYDNLPDSVLNNDFSYYTPVFT